MTAQRCRVTVRFLPAMPPLCRLVGIALLLCAGCLPSWSGEPARKITDYVHNSWQTELPQNSVQAILQTRDGYLWLGTQTGLIRFDGLRFTEMSKFGDVSLEKQSIVQVVEDDTHALWIATKNDGLYKRHEYRLRDGEQGLWIITTLRNESETRHKVNRRDEWTRFNESGTADPASRAMYMICSSFAICSFRGTGTGRV